jgi:Spy/CpxP family protein refolding chaperone
LVEVAMSKKLLTILLVLSVAVNLLAVFALGAYFRQSARPSKPPMQQERVLALDQLRERFGLTEAQMESVRVLHKYRHDNVRPVQDRLEAMQAEMLALLQAPELDRPRVDSLLGAMTAARDSMEQMALDVMLRMRGVLTPEQLARLPELFGDLQRVGRRPPRGPRPEPDEGPGSGPPPGRPGR